MAKKVANDPQKQTIIDMLEQTTVLMKQVEQVQAKVRKIMEQMIKQANNQKKPMTPK